VTVDPASATIKASEKDAKVTLKAANDAALGQHSITVTATPARSGDKTTAPLKIEVVKP
jgi:hypothetical protein